MKTIKKIYSKNNNEIVLLKGEFCSNQNSPDKKNILIIGVVHGDEFQGKFLIDNYLTNKNSFKNNMLFIPCLNPDGLELKTRQNANKVDINRNFPTKNWGVNVSDNADYYGGVSPASEIETKFVAEVLNEYKPDVILTLHSPYKVVNYDGPAKEIAENISKIIGYPATTDIGYPTPGSFGTYAGIERNIPTITLELDEEVDLNNLIEPVGKIFDYLSEI